MQLKHKAFVASAALIATGGLAAAGISASANGSDSGAADTSVSGRLNPLNSSGVTGKATVHQEGERVLVEVTARRLAPNLPHAQHIHFGAQARHECPTIADDANGDFRLTTTDGAPAYGPVRVSLTTKGDTSADSVLAVDRYPTASKGQVDYSRQTRVGKAVARGIRNGEAIVVIHGVDYNHNGTYDFDSAGTSDLDESLPAEATDPATCAVLR
jgi:hypothetical protein